MTSSPPLVSILVVTWNRRTDLARCLESARAQTWPHREIVVVDNASTDGTADLVRERFPEVRLLQAPANLGCPSGRNFGIPHCQGRYIYMLDDDGWLRADAVELCVGRAEAEPSIAVVMSRVHVMEGGRVTGRYPAGQETAGYRADFSGGCSLVRAEALRVAGVFPDDFVRQGEEGDLALRLLEAGYSCFLEPASVMCHAPSPVGRNPALIHFYTLRNANKTALRLWPMPWCWARPLLNLGRAVISACRHGYPRLPLDLLLHLASDLRAWPQRRRPVSRATFRLFRSLSLRATSQRPDRGRPGSRSHHGPELAAASQPAPPHVH